MRRWITLLLVAALPAVAHGQGRTSGGTQAQQAVIKADQAFAAKKMKAAIRLYNQALAYDRTLTAAYEKLAIAYYATGQYRPAVTKLGICLQVAPQDVKCHMWLGMHLLKLKQRARGYQMLEAAVKLDWKLPLAMRKLGFYYFNKGDWRRAEKAFWTFLKHRDKSWPAKVDFVAHFMLGRTYNELKNYPAAQAQFAKAIKLRKNHSGAKLGLATTLLGRGYYNTALNLLLPLSGLAKRKPIIHFYLAKCFYRMRRKQKALNHLKHYADKVPGDVQTLILKGDIYFLHREYGPALAAYKQATQKAPNSVAAKIKYGEALLQQKRAREALAVLQAADQKSPNNPKVLVVLGQAQLDLKQPADALRTFDKLVQAQPKASLGWSLRGDAHLAGKQVDKAIADYEKARTLNPQEWRAKRGLIRALNWRARDLVVKGKITEAITDLSKAFALDPKRMFTNTNMGIAYLKAKKYKEAARHLTEVHSKLPRNFAVNRLLGRLYYETGKLAQARRHYERARVAARKLPSRFQAEVEIELGALLAAQKDTNTAVSVLESAKSNAEGSKDLEPIARGNYAIALLDRGYQNLEARKGKEAVKDLEEARNHVKYLTGNQPLLVRFLLAMAYLETSRWGKAATAFRKLSGRRMLAKVLKPPFDRLGAGYFQAYTKYRQGAYEAAAVAMRRLMRRAKGPVRGRIREIIRSSFEMRATQLVRRGQHGKAAGLFKQAAAFGLSRPGKHNRAVSLYRSGKQGKALSMWKAGGMPTMALCNVGTHYDNAGNPQLAYQYYKRCGGGADIKKRIATIKRIFGYK